MKKWFMAIAIMALMAFSMASASTLIIDGKTVEGTVTITTSGAPTPPPTTCPTGQRWDSTLNKCVTDTPIPPVSGQFTVAINGAYRCDTQLVGGIGGYGFYQGNVPGPASVRSNKKTYFLFDPSWLPIKYQSAGKLLTIKWINFSITGKSQTTNLIQLDSSDNGKVINTNGGKQASFGVQYKAGVRWLIEVDTTTSGDGFALSIKWP